MIRLLRWCVLVGCLVLAHASQAAVLLVNGDGKLTGATGVDVAGTLYDVQFSDGSCVAVFTGCDSAADFVFPTVLSAQAASAALLDQVLLDGAAGNFDSLPILTAGCGFYYFCDVYTPYAVQQQSGGVGVFFAFTSNADVESFDFASSSAPFDPADSIFTGTDLSSTLRTWASWSLASPAAVPEPGTMAILGGGLLALILTRRRRAVTRGRTG